MLANDQKNESSVAETCNSDKSSTAIIFFTFAGGFMRVIEFVFVVEGQFGACFDEFIGEKGNRWESFVIINKHFLHEHIWIA